MARAHPPPRPRPPHAQPTLSPRACPCTHRYQRDVVALRVVIANPLTTEADIDANLNEQLSLIRG